MSELALSEARAQHTEDVVKDVADDEVDSLRSVFRALKVEPCRIRLVSTTPIIRGQKQTALTFVAHYPRDPVLARVLAMAL